MVAPRGRHVSGGWTKVNFAILLHLLLSNNAANADVIMSHQEMLDQKNFKQNVLIVIIFFTVLVLHDAADFLDIF